MASGSERMVLCRASTSVARPTFSARRCYRVRQRLNSSVLADIPPNNGKNRRQQRQHLPRRILFLSPSISRCVRHPKEIGLNTTCCSCRLRAMVSASSLYVLGTSAHEYERLMLQAKLLRPYTEKFFRMAGLATGMRVLDVGSGMGDVALLTAEIVGPGGRVLGLDRDAAGLEHARERTRQHGCASWVSYEAAHLNDFGTTEQFDAIVGRYILLYQPDAGATLRQLLRCLKPGGIVVFHELDFSDPRSSDPPCRLWDEAYALLGEAFRRAGAPPDYGRRMATAFLDAGLPFPVIVAESIAGGGRGSYLYPWIASTLISVLPRMAQMGLVVPPGLTIDDTLAPCLEAACVAARTQILGPIQFGAWTRKPVA
jgi:ubiquinone/menaquinone biosynthesis C-methylase UbiE